MAPTLATPFWPSPPPLCRSLSAPQAHLRPVSLPPRAHRTALGTRELLEDKVRLKDKEIAHLTDVAATYKASYEALKESNSQLAASMLAPPVAEPAADSRELNEYGDVGAR